MQGLANEEGKGMARVMYRKDTAESLHIHILGLHAADLMHQALKAVATCKVFR